MSGLGQQLRAIREQSGTTISEVAAATRLKTLVIDAMERDDFNRLIAPAYARGFYKLYCDYLGVDPAPFIAAYLDRKSVM